MDRYELTDMNCLFISKGLEMLAGNFDDGVLNHTVIVNSKKGNILKCGPGNYCRSRDRL